MNNCNFLGRFVDIPKLEVTHNTHVTNFKLNVEEFRKDRDGLTKKRNNILTFEAWDTAAKAICKQAEEGGYMAVSAIARNYRGEYVFRVTSFKIFPPGEEGTNE